MDFRLAVVSSGKAFLPEMLAYKKYFEEHGFDVDFLNADQVSVANHDVTLLFCGFYPFWRKYSGTVVAEYHSLSTGRWSKVKDFLKGFFNVSPSCYVFLNEYVQKNINVRNERPSVLRPMGYDGDLVRSSLREEKIYDVAYVGSVRDGVKEAVVKLADLGARVVVAGNVDDIRHNNVECFGKVSIEEAYRLMSMSTLGLNYTPDIEPWSKQDSTKVIEYCALGMGVITNSYEWVRDFEVSRGARFLDIEKISCLRDITNFQYIVPDVADLEWRKVMDDSGLVEMIKRFL